MRTSPSLRSWLSARLRFGVPSELFALQVARLAGTQITTIDPRVLLPYSFRGRLPASPELTRAYLRCPVLWQMLGKQFLVLGVKPG